MSCALNHYCYTSDEYKEPLDPDYLKAFSQLEILDLSRNSLGEWQDDRFAENSHLKKLYLHSNRFSHITKGLIQSFARLTEIDFRYNNNLECDQSIAEFFNLTLTVKTLNVVGWDQGQGYLCRNMTNYTQITFKEYYDWYLEVIDYFI